MARKYLLPTTFFSLLSSLCASLFTSSPATAEVACVAEVAYRWVQEQSGAQTGAGEPPAAESGVEAVKGDTQPGADPTQLPPQQEPTGQRVKFITIERRGADEAATKAELLVEVNRQKARAQERCKKDHEGFGECVGSKLSARGTTLNSLSFSARVKLEEALVEQCKLQQGRCVGVDSEEPTCRAVVDPAAKATAEAVEQGSSADAAAGDGKAGGDKSKRGKSSEPAPAKAKSGKAKS